MAVLLTGSSGLVGSAVCKELVEKPETIGYNEIYKTSDKELKRAFSKISQVIHCAAPTNLDIGEIDKSRQYSDIVELTEKLSRVTPSDTHFIYISSTGVYGEQKSTPHLESEICAPTSFHHRCKLAAEQIVLEYKRNVKILRLGWVYDDLNYSAEDFVKKMIKVLEGNSIIETNDSQKGCPTPTSLICEVINKLLRSNVDEKIINVVASGVATRKEYISFINQAAKTGCKINSAPKFHRVAKVSSNETADNALLSQILGKIIPSWEIYLQRGIENKLG